MSRSYKHTPIYTDRTHGAKWWKRQANKKVRRYKRELDNGKMYKKIYESWEIHDWISRWSKQEAINYWYKCNSDCSYYWYNITKDYSTLENFLDKSWAHDYYWK